jgi:HTH-type transcriptional regulator / antitoxin HigA
MAAILTFTPDYVSPPGETLEDVLEDRGMSQAELAERTGLSRKTVNEIIKGKASITSETALHLERVLGVPAGFWNSREHQYREALARQKETERLMQHVDWIARFPYREMADMDLVARVDGRASDAVARRGRELLDYFGVASPEQWQQVWLEPNASFRKALTFTSTPEPVSAWLRYGEKMAMEKLETEPYDEKKFRAVLVEMRNLTRETPDVFSERMVRICAEAGVAVVFTPQLPGARISGATQWLHSDLALIQLSLRYRTNDHFWFTFFHEAAHILLHGKRDVFLEGSGDDSEQVKENEANRWAATFLIPESKMKAFLARGEWSREAILSFADELRIAPGIVVGQLQHRKVIPYSHLNGLKQKFEWRR